MKTRYDAMKRGTVKNEKGLYYPDVLTFPKDKLVRNYPTKTKEITQQMKDRFYLACNKQYGRSEYDDIVLWLNGIESVHEVSIGTEIEFPDMRDINRFFSKYTVRRFR